jgi:hypothetical protein
MPLLSNAFLFVRTVGARLLFVGHHLMKICREEHAGATAVGARDLLPNSPVAKPLAPHSIAR